MQRSSTGVAPFIEKTLAILGNPALAPAISWSEDGRSIVVSNSAAVATTVLPAYFKRRKTYASFAKDLVKYGFRKVAAVTGGDSRDHFEHAIVTRGVDETALRTVKAASKRSKRAPKHAAAPRSQDDAGGHASDDDDSSGSDDDDSVDAAPAAPESRKRARFEVAVDARLLSKARRRSSGSKRKTTRPRKSSSKSKSTRAPAAARGVDVHDPVAALNELRVFHRRQKEMLSRIVTMETRVESLARDAQVLYASVVAVRDQQAAVHSIMSSVLSDGAAAAADLMPREDVMPTPAAAIAPKPLT